MPGRKKRSRQAVVVKASKRLGSKRPATSIKKRSRKKHSKLRTKIGRSPKQQTKTARGETRPRLELGLRLLRTEKSIANAALKVGISPTKLRAHAIKKKLLVKRGKRWVVQKDVPRKVLIYSDGKEHAITVAKFRTASLIGEHMAAVRWFVQTNDLRHLEPFAGKSVKDISGKRFPLETRPNVLHRLANSGGSSFEDVYRLVI